MVKRVMNGMFLLIGLTASLIFYFHLGHNDSNVAMMKGTLQSINWFNKFVELQLNLRSLLNIPNQIEYGY